MPTKAELEGQIAELEEKIASTPTTEGAEEIAVALQESQEKLSVAEQTIEQLKQEVPATDEDRTTFEIGKENAELRAALQPFANKNILADADLMQMRDSEGVVMSVRVGALRKACELMG